MGLVETNGRDRNHGFVPLEDSIRAFSVEGGISPNASQIFAVSNYRLSVLVAIAREDDALSRRAGRQGLIFLGNVVAITPLADARAGAAVFHRSYVQYCAHHHIDPLKTLIKNGTKPEDARSFFEYSGTMFKLITEAMEAQGKQS